MSGSETKPKPAEEEDSNLPSISPPASSFTFSTGEDVAKYQPFGANTPARSEAEREWSYSGPVKKKITAAPEPAPAPAPVPEGRRFAPLRGKKGVTEEARNEEQREKQKEKDETIKNLGDTILHLLTATKQYEKEIEGQEQVISDQKQYIEGLGKAVEAIKANIAVAEEKATAKVKEKETEITDLQKANMELEAAAKNQAAETATKHPSTEVQDLKNMISALERRNESLNAEFDAIRSRLEAAEAKSTEVSTSYRLAQTTIGNHLASIKNLERQIEDREGAIAKLEQDAATKDSRIKLKDDDIRNKKAEIDNLTNLNKQVRQENTRLKSQTEKLERQLRSCNDDIAILRVVNQDYDFLKKEGIQAKEKVKQLRTEIGKLEYQNHDLKTKWEDQALLLPHQASRSTRSLGSELSDSEYLDVGEGTFSNISTIHDGDPQVFPRNPTITGPEPTTSESAIESQDIYGTSEAGSSPDLDTPQAVTNSSQGTQSALVTGAPEVVTTTRDTTGQETSTAPLVITVPHSGRIPLVDTAAQSGTTPQSGTAAQTGTAPQVIIHPPLTILEPGTTQTGPAGSLQLVVLNNHNPLECWLQVYIDLWFLLLFYGNQWLKKSFGHLDTVSLASGRVEEDLADVPQSATIRRDVAFTATGTARSSFGYSELEKDVPDAWSTLLALCFHILFYGGVIIVALNYRALIKERSMWLSANDITRTYLHTFYKLPFRRQYGVFYELYGPFRIIDVLRYTIHTWVPITRSLPG